MKMFHVKRFRRKRHKRLPYNRGRLKRDSFHITKYKPVLFSAFLKKQSLMKYAVASYFNRSLSKDSNDIVSDRRRFVPIRQKHEFGLTAHGMLAKVKHSDSRKDMVERRRPYYLFDNPQGVMVCIRRKERRKALFKSGKAGKGKRILGDRVWNESSKIVCK